MGQEAAHRTIEQHRRKFETTYLFGLSHDALVTEVSQIPGDSIVIFLAFLVDGAGKTFVPRNVVKEIARISPAPVYGPYDTYIGNGVVGGFVDILGFARGHSLRFGIPDCCRQGPASLPPQANPRLTFRVDARAWTDGA